MVIALGKIRPTPCSCNLQDTFTCAPSDPYTQFLHPKSIRKVVWTDCRCPVRTHEVVWWLQGALCIMWEVNNSASVGTQSLEHTWQ